MLNVSGRRSPSPSNNRANNKHPSSEHPQQPSPGRFDSGGRRLRNKKTATIDDDSNPRCFFSPETTRRASSALWASTQITRDDSELSAVERRRSPLARNMATSRTVRVKPTFSKADSSTTTSSTSASNKRRLLLVRPVLCLTTGQRQAVASSWRQLKEHYGERPAEQILHKLINDEPKTKDLFYQAAFLTVFTRCSNSSITTFRDHARLLHRSIDQLVENLDSRTGGGNGAIERSLKELRDQGAKHAFLRKSGFKPETWERFGEAAVDVINAYECVKNSPEASKAWTVLIASITDELRSGFESEARKQSYCSDRPKSACD